MPLINVKVSGAPDVTLSKQIHTTLLALTSNILKKDPNVTAVAINYIPKEQWFIAGKSLADTNKNSFSLEIKITDETNTKAEKQAYIHAVFSAFTKILSNVHEESYIHINDVKAASYGYGGYTQEYRYQQANTA